MPVQHRAALNLRSFLHENVFILPFVEGHNVFLHFDIDQVKTRFTREPLAATVPLVNLTVACVPKKHRVEVNLRSLLQENVFILPFIAGHNDVLHFDIAQVKTRFTREPLVTTVSSVNLTLACVPVKHRAAFILRSFLHENVFILLFISTLTSPRSKHASRGSLLSTNVSLVNLTLACVPVKHCAALNLMSFLHESVFMILFIVSHDVLLHFDIALVKTRCTREPLVTTVALLNLTVARVPEKHRAAFNLDLLPRECLHSPLHLHFDIAQV